MCIDTVVTRVPVRSPFARVVVFSIYDGPTAGVAICPDSEMAYLFTIVAWDSRQDKRVFALARMQHADLAELYRVLNTSEHARWPEWWLDRTQAHPATEEALAALARGILPVSHVIVTSDILKVVDKGIAVDSERQKREYGRLSVRASETAEVSDHGYEEWVQFLDSPV